MQLRNIFEKLVTNNITHYQQTKLLQALAWGGMLITLLFFWNTTYFLWAWLFAWLSSGIGLGICHHRYAAHKTFEPKNRLIKWFILFVGTIITHGSVIAWSITHRYHHRFTDKDQDPTNPEGSFWFKVKCFLYYFKDLERPNSQVMVLDLVKDRDFIFFHKHHFKIIFIYIGLLALINPLLVGYFYCFTVCYVLFTSGWVTTLAHSPGTSIFGYRNYDTDDKTYNSVFWQLWSMGDGYHNNHHACPWLWNMAVTKYEFDICGQLVKLLGYPNDIPPLPIKGIK